MTAADFKISCVGTQESNSKPSGKWQDLLSTCGAAPTVRGLLLGLEW